MAGRRLDVDSIGESYEVFAESVLNRIATLTRIGTKQDFGTDTYCQPRVKIGARTETVTELCLLQVKGGESPLAYGGVDDKGQWKGYEFEWLRNLWAPLYLAKVDNEYQHVDLFSLWSIWWVMWQSDAPFKVVVSTRDASNEPHCIVPPKNDAVHGIRGMGDGRVWTVELGPPLLRLTHENLNDDDFRNEALEIFRHWIRVDRQTIARYHTGIPFLNANHRWSTSKMPDARQEKLAIDPRPGAKIECLARGLAPSLLALGAHLQHQDNADAYLLIPLLEWMESRGYDNLIMPQLLTNLRRARDENVGPRAYL